MTLFEMPVILTLDDAMSAFRLIVDALTHMQYSGRLEGRNNGAKRRERTRLNAFSDEFQAVCNNRAAEETDTDTKAKWVAIRDEMAKRKTSLNAHKEVIMGQDGVY